MLSDTDLCDKSLFKLLCDHQEILEFRLNYSMKDLIVDDLMVGLLL